MIRRLPRQSFESEDERRRRARAAAPTIVLDLDGILIESSNWSRGGALVEDYEGRLTAGSLLAVTRMKRKGGNLVPVHIRARVVRAEDAGHRLAIQFLEVDRRAYELFEALDARKADLSTSPPPRPSPPLPGPPAVHPALEGLDRWPPRKSTGLSLDS